MVCTNVVCTGHLGSQTPKCSSTTCTGAWEPRVRAWLLHTLACPRLLPGLGALQVLARDQPGCVDAFFVDAVQPCGGEAPVKRCSRAWPRQSLWIGSPGGGGTKHGTLPLRMEEGLETTLRRCGDGVHAPGPRQCSRPSAAGAVPRGQVSGGRTCCCTATLGGAAFGQGELGKLPGFQLSASKKIKIKGSGGRESSSDPNISAADTGRDLLEGPETRTNSPSGM